MLKYTLLLFFTCTIHVVYSNPPNIPKTTFGNVSVQDFNATDIFPQHDAVTLVDACSISFEPNNSGGFSIVR
jgi:hypothetical protein